VWEEEEEEEEEGVGKILSPKGKSRPGEDKKQEREEEQRIEKWFPS